MDQKTPRRTAFRLIACMVLFAGTTIAAAQSTDTSAVPLSLADLDLSAASIHQAGSSSFYVRTVGVDGDRYSFLIEQDAGDAWSVTRIIPESANILPPDAILDFATISLSDENRIRIEGVVVGGRVYSGSLSVGDDADLELAEQIQVSSRGPLNEARARAVKEILAAETRTELEKRLQEQLAFLEEVVDRVEAQRDTFREERDELAQQNEQLAAERDALQAERDRLEERLAELPGATVGGEDAATDADARADVGTADAADADAGPSGAAAESAGDSPLSGEQVEALLDERDQLAGDIVGLVMENNELRAERQSLREQIQDLEQRNSGLQEDIATMTSEVERLQELVQVYRSTVGSPPDGSDDAAGDDGVTTEGETEPEQPRELPALPGDYVRAGDLEEAAADVTGELRALEARLASLEQAASGLAELEEALRTGVRRGLPGTRLVAEPAGDLPGTVDEADPGVPRATPDGESEIPTAAARPEPRETAPAATAAPPADENAADENAADEDAARAALESAEQAEQIARLKAEVAELLEANEALRREKQNLEERVLNEILNNGFVRMMRERLSRRLVRGFSAGEPDTGTWNVSSGLARQMDENAFFAKLALPVRQDEGPVLYSFRVRSLDPEGWVGFGLHLFVERVERRRGFGMGSSLLAWFTRDPQERKSNTTYLQLYKSDDDVNMARVLDAAIPEGMNEWMDVDVLYEPTSQYITIAVDGTDRVRYRTWFGVDSGVEIALRSLGRAEFREFSVSTLPVAP